MARTLWKVFLVGCSIHSHLESATCVRLVCLVGFLLVVVVILFCFGGWVFFGGFAFCLEKGNYYLKPQFFPASCRHTWLHMHMPLTNDLSKQNTSSHPPKCNFTFSETINPVLIGAAPSADITEQSLTNHRVLGARHCVCASPSINQEPREEEESIDSIF